METKLRREGMINPAQKGLLIIGAKQHVAV